MAIGLIHDITIIGWSHLMKWNVLDWIFHNNKWVDIKVHDLSENIYRQLGIVQKQKRNGRGKKT